MVPSPTMPKVFPVHASGKINQKSERMLCDTRRRVAGDITYRNPCRLSCIQIHTVSSCGGNADKLQLRCLLKRCLVNDHLIGNGDAGVL